jgi:hypothetical protein
MVTAVCDKGSTKNLEALLSRVDTVFLDEPYLEALKFIVRYVLRCKHIVLVFAQQLT